MEFKPGVIKVIVKTNMPKTKLIKYDDLREAYLMDISALPENGKANLEIIKFIKKCGFEAKFLSGASSRIKLLKLS